MIGKDDYYVGKRVFITDDFGKSEPVKMHKIEAVIDTENEGRRFIVSGYTDPLKETDMICSFPFRKITVKFNGKTEEKKYRGMFRGDNFYYCEDIEKGYLCSLWGDDMPYVWSRIIKAPYESFKFGRIQYSNYVNSFAKSLAKFKEKVAFYYYEIEENL